MKNNRTDQYVTAGLTVLGIIFILIAVVNQQTGFTGDSLMHYLFSRYSFRYPEFFFNHWAKPVFVLLSSPFAQWGFPGIKVFNSLVAVLTGYFTYRTAKLLEKKNAWVAPVLLFFSPLYFSLVFSGLTEYLFALTLMVGTFLLIKGEKITTAAIILSFLPFIRSEGLISLIVIGAYFLILRKWKYVPLLLTGHLIYAIAGYFIHDDLLWVFSHNPYASLGSPYGAGGPFDFFSKMLNVIGIPVYILAAAGIIFRIYNHIRSGIRQNLHQKEEFLIYFHFLAFFTAHSLFWWLGIFNSMGLSRVMIAVVPLVAIIAMQGLNGLAQLRFLEKTRIASWFMILMMGYVIIFPFTGNPYAINADRFFRSPPDKKMMDEQILSIIQEGSGDHLLYYDHPYISVALGIDHFDEKIRKPTRFVRFDKGRDLRSLVIFDNVYSESEGWTSESYNEAKEYMKAVASFSKESRDKIYIFEVFEIE